MDLLSEDGATLFLGLGSNLGDRRGHLDAALEGLAAVGLTPLRMSTVHETAPWGPVAQGDFLNMVVEVRLPCSVWEAFEHTRRLELALGRERGLRYGPRTIDIDLLASGELVLDMPGLVLPHPRVGERAFVLRPWAEIAPGYVVPGLGKPVLVLLEELEG